LTAKELKNADRYLVQIAQSEFPSSEKQEKDLKIFELNDILRCRGRLDESNLRREKKFPIFLPNKTWITKLIVMEMHQTNHLLWNFNIFSHIKRKILVDQRKKKH
jgi:hypothetical protein